MRTASRFGIGIPTCEFSIREIREIRGQFLWLRLCRSGKSVVQFLPLRLAPVRCLSQRSRVANLPRQSEWGLDNGRFRAFFAGLSLLQMRGAWQLSTIGKNFHSRLFRFARNDVMCDYVGLPPLPSHRKFQNEVQGKHYPRQRLMTLPISADSKIWTRSLWLTMNRHFERC